MAHKKLSPEDLKRVREAEARYDAARAGAHISPGQFEAAHAAFWRLWEEIFEAYGLDDCRNHSVALATGAIVREREPRFEPVED